METLSINEIAAALKDAYEFVLCYKEKTGDKQFKVRLQTNVASLEALGMLAISQKLVLDGQAKDTPPALVTTPAENKNAG